MNDTPNQDENKKPSRVKIRRLSELSNNTFISLLTISVLLIGLLSGVVLVRNPQNINEKAQTVIHPIHWNTSYVAISADDLYVEAYGKTFYPPMNDVGINVKSDPGDPRYTTLEVDWVDGTIPMRLYMYFRNDGSKWWAYELRTYNGDTPGDWLTYTDQAPYFQSNMGDYYSGDAGFMSNGGGGGHIYFKNLRLKAFANYLPFNNEYQFWPPEGDNVHVGITNHYSLVASLYDADVQLVADQSAFDYRWEVGDPTILSVRTEQLCLPGVNEPCPSAHAQLQTYKAGTTTVSVKAVDKSTGDTVAFTYWNIIVSTNELKPPSDVHFSSEVNREGTLVNIKLSWTDNSSNEKGFLLGWYIEGYGLSSIVDDHPDDTSYIITSIPCGDTPRQLSGVGSVYAYNDTQLTVPVYAREMIDIPACPNIPGGADPRADINEDGIVDILDYSILFENFGLRVTQQ